MKQLAVEWLMQQLPTIDKYDPYYQDLFTQAKEMEKEQIIEAYNTSFLLRDKPYETAEKYYKETYESNTCLLNDGCDGIRCYNCINNRNI